MTDTSKTIDRRVTVIVLVVTVAYLIAMLQYPFKAYIVPVIVAGATLVAAVIQLVKQLRLSDDEESTAGSGDLGRLSPEGRKRLALIFGWTVGVVLAILAFGFVVGPGLMALILMRIERESWLAWVLVPGILVLLTYVLMSAVLGLPVLDGAFWDWVS